MSAQHTTTSISAIGAFNAPLNNRNEHQVYGYIGFLKSALEKQRHAEVLWNHFYRLKNSKLSEACLEGHMALKDVERHDVEHLQKYGQLLLCWSGTAVLRGAA